MANKYSKYTLRPAVSNYVDPGSVKVNEILRERYDKNKAQKDLLDRTLSGMNVMQGDQYLMENAKTDIRTQLSEVVSSGAYEDAGLAIQEAITGLAGDKGVQAAQKSYENRQKELEFITKQRQQGIEILDFGKFQGEGHKSYTQNEDGTFATNIYQPLSESKLEYGEKMKTLFSNMKANSWGIDQNDVNGAVNRMYGAYLNSREGSQDFRRLVELEYDETIPFEQRKEMAKKDIKNRLNAFASNHLHTKQTKPKEPTKYQQGQLDLYEQMMGVKPSINKAGVSFDAGHQISAMTGETTTLATMSSLISHVKNGDMKAARDTQINHRKIIDRLEINGHVSPDQAKLYREKNIELFEVMKNADFSQNKSLAVEAYLKYATTKVPIGDGSTLDPYMKNAKQESLEFLKKGLPIGAGSSLGSKLLRMPLVSKSIWAVTAGLSVGYGGYKLIEGGIGRAFDQRGNVRGFMNPESEDSFGSYLGLDTEMEDLMQNLSDVDQINRVFGLKGEDALTPQDTDLIKTIGADYLTYMQNDGDIIDEIMDENGGGAVDYAVEMPDISTDNGKAGAKMLNYIMDNGSITDYRVMEFPETSDEWKDLTKDGTQVSTKGYISKGIVPASLMFNTPTRLSVIRPGKGKEGDKQMILEPKIAEGAAGLETLAGQFGKATGNLQYAVIENAQQMLQDKVSPDISQTADAVMQSTLLVAQQAGLKEDAMIIQSYKYAMRLVLGEMGKSFYPWKASIDEDYAAVATNVEYDPKTGALTGMDERQRANYEEILDQRIFGTFEKINGKNTLVEPGFVHRSDIKLR
tara:strand:+ start:36846 stop:39257 length:2412 start_codon:yes stop_codon:yes gene_type:complete